MGEEQINKRRFPRMPSQHLVMVERESAPDAGTLTKTRCVSQGGCGLILEDSFEEGSMIIVHIAVRDRIVKAEARVVYQNESEQGRFETGVEFIDIDDRDRKAIAELFENM